MAKKAKQSTDLKINAIKDSIVLVMRQELQAFLLEMTKLLELRINADLTETPIINDKHLPDYDTPDITNVVLVEHSVNENENTLVNSKLPSVVERSQPSKLSNAETKKVKLIFGDFLERVHGSDEGKLNDAVDFWEKALNHVNVGRTMERLRYAPPVLSKVSE